MAAPEDKSAIAHFGPDMVAGEIEGGMEFDGGFYASRGAAQQANNLVVAIHVLAGVGGLAAPPQRHEVGKLQHTGGGGKPRLQDVGGGQIAAGAGFHVAGSDAAIAAFFVIQKAEKHGPAVKVRQAGPVQGTFRADQGGGMGVAYNRIVFDWPVHAYSE